MCGIFFCIFKDGHCCKKRIEHLAHKVKPLIRRRGPDDYNTKEKILSDQQSGQAFKLVLTGAVLHLRGSLTPQPVEDDQGNVLLWNGEVFGGIHIPEDNNDTSVLSCLLGNQSNPAHVLSVMSCLQGPWSFVYYQASEGKLWFGRDYFGRRSLVWHLPRDNNDVMAVSSVAQRRDEQSDIKLVWEEVPADGVYCLESNTQGTKQTQLVETFKFNHFKLTKYPWTSVSKNFKSDDNNYVMQAPVQPFNKELPSESDLECLKYEQKRVQVNGLREGVHVNCSSQLSVCTNTEKTGILETKDSLVKIEGQSDTNNLQNLCKVGECFIHERVKLHVLKEEAELKQNRTDSFSTFLSNHPSSCEQSKGVTSHKIDTLRELCNKVVLSSNTSRETTRSCKNIENSASFLNARDFETLRRDGPDSLPEKLVMILGEAVRKRVFNLPRIFFSSERQEHENHGECNTEIKLPCEKEQLLRTKDIYGNTSEDISSLGRYDLAGSRVGVLFSGGIDSIVLAALADRFVPSTEAIDLINVAFEQKIPKQNPTNKRKAKPSEQEGKERLRSFDVPDRVTGRQGLLELHNINPERRWNFIEVNVNLKELQEARSQHITHLVSPLTSVLDDSIGCALWFAARGSGVLRCPRCVTESPGNVTKECVHPQEYTSPAKVLLVGMGADEQLGGYARHRTKFNQQGWQGLVDEMEMEVNRISQRNLGRDDRCISDHGREARFPFLDEQVVSFLSTLPVWLKADPRLPRGTGEKILLRQAAKLLGLTSSADLPKRAIQFGSRIAKLEGSSEKGSDTCSRLNSI